VLTYVWACRPPWITHVEAEKEDAPKILVATEYPTWSVLVWILLVTRLPFGFWMAAELNRN
jgi:hypothetical protein